MALSDEWEIEYYETATGRKPVLKWIEGMNPTSRALALQHIDQLKLLGLEAGMPLVRILGNKLYELRWKAENKQHRIAYFAVTGRTFVLLHGFIKKTQGTSDQDLNTARERMKEYLTNVASSHCGNTILCELMSRLDYRAFMPSLANNVS